MKASLLLRTALSLAGGALIVYSFVVMTFVRYGAGQLICILLGLPLLLWGVFHGPLSAWTQSGVGAVILRFAVIGYGSAALVIALFCGAMFAVAARIPDAGADAVIVLGAGLRGEEVSLTLKKRLDAACDYLAENPETVCVLSGGQGPDEPIPEAEAMRRYMEGRGVDPARLLVEDQSLNTAQNIAYSKEVLAGCGDAPRVVIATSDFHVLRGTLLAKGAGFDNAQGLSSRSEPYLLPQYCLREIIGIVKDGVMGRY